MNVLSLLALSSAAQAAKPVQLRTFMETLVRGGPVMIPLAACSVIALAWMMERALRMRGKVLGNRAQTDLILGAIREGGPTKGLEVARRTPTVLSRIIEPALERWNENGPTVEKAVEDAGSRELRGLLSSLRPLSVIAVCAPLLGLLGTVIGIIIAFRDIALSDAMGKPEALAVGIAQALVTTATGLAVAIPTQAAYYWFRARIDRFRRLVEESGERVLAIHDGRSPRSAPPAPMAELPAPVFPNAATAPAAS
jgi:biopolymer transport protein ExbB